MCVFWSLGFDFVCGFWCFFIVCGCEIQFVGCLIFVVVVVWYVVWYGSQSQLKYFKLIKPPHPDVRKSHRWRLENRLLMVLSKGGEGITDPYSAVAYLPNNHTNSTMHTPTYKASKYRGTPKLTTKIPVCVCVCVCKTTFKKVWNFVMCHSIWKENLNTLKPRVYLYKLLENGILSLK